MSRQTARINRKLAELSNDQLHADKYRKLAAFAAELGLEFEAERAREAANEMDAEADDRRAELLFLGYDPDDDERQADHIAGEASMAGLGIL